MTDTRPGDNRHRQIALAVLLGITCFLGSRDITDESSGMLTADMARYAMNGVFVRDLIADGGAFSYGELESYAEHYYAKYPALSLGHHPPLTYFALVPFFATFGISLFAARLAALCWFVLAAWGLYAVAKRLFNWQVASWATALFVTNVLVLRFGQSVLSEMPMLALVLVSLNALFVYCDTGRTRHFALFVFTVVASLFAKQLAALMLPVYGVVLVTRLGWKSLRNRHVVLTAVAGFLIAAPLVVATVVLSPNNVLLVSNNVSRLFSGLRRVSMTSIVTRAVSTHLSLPILMVVAAGTVALLLRRDRRVIVCLTWLGAVIAATVIIAGAVEPARYSFGAMPAYFLLAASLAAGWSSRPARWAAALVLASAVTWQAWLVRDLRPSGAGGYEAAARYVVDNSSEPTVLFDTEVDTGYFVFFVRKHDTSRRLVLLRADKVMKIPAGRARARAAGQALDPSAIYANLRTYGIRFIVVEEQERDLAILRVLHSELKTDRFVERQRIPITSREPRVQGVDLVIYEFKDAQPADLDAEVDIDLPRGNRDIKIRLRDLIGTGGR